MAHNHHCDFVYKHAQPLPDPEFRHRKALPHGFNSFQPPPKRVPAAWKAEGGEPSQFDHPPQPLYQPDRYNRWTSPRIAETARGKEIHAKLDYLLAASDKWENKWDATDRRIGRFYAPSRPEPAPDRGEHQSAGQPWRDPSPPPLTDGPTPPRHPNERGSFHDQPHLQTIANNWDQVGWDDRRDHRQRQGFEEYPRRHQHLHHGRAEQPTYRSPQSDRLLSHGTADAPPRSGFTHRPKQSSKFIDSGKQRGLPNTPNLLVRSPCPAQLATVSDYKEKLHLYRLEQAALLARMNALFEESVDDKNLAENVLENVAHNGGVNIEVPTDESLEEVPNDESLEEIVKPYDESLEEIVKMDNMPPQVLVGAYDQEIGDLIVPTRRELEMKGVVENCSSENGGSLLRIFSKDSLCVDVRKFTFGAVFDVKSGDLLYPTQWELEIKDEVGNGSAFARLQRPGTFDPGGDKSPKLLLSTLLVASWFPP